jgi:hypothetical protein
MSFRLRLLVGGTRVSGDREQLSDRWSPMNFPTSFIFRIPDSDCPSPNLRSPLFPLAPLLPR